MSDSQLPLQTSPDTKSATNALVPVQAIAHPIPRPEFAPPVAISGMPNALSLLKALRRRWLSALLVGLLVGTGAGCAVWFFLPPPKQIARTQLHAPLIPQGFLGPAENRLTGEAFLRNQAFIIKDPFVLNAVLNDSEAAKQSVLKEQPDQLQWLSDEIKVDFLGSEFIQISMSGDRPQELLVLVNAVRKAYLEQTTDKEVKERDNQLRVLKEFQAEWEAKAKSKRWKLRELRTASGVIDVANMAVLEKMALEEMESARKELLRVRGEIRPLAVEIGLKPEWREAGWPPLAAALTSSPAPLQPINSALVGLLYDEFLVSGRQAGEDIETLLASDPVVATEIKEIQKLEMLIEGYHKTANPKKLEQLTKPLREQRDTLKNYVLAYAQRRGLAQLREQSKKDPKSSQAASVRERYAVARELERRLLEEVQRLDQLTANKNRVAMDLTDIKDEVAKAEDIVIRANKKIDALEMEQKAPARVRDFGEGSIYTPDAAKRKLMFTAGAAGGSLILILLAFAWFEFSTRKVHSPEEVVQSLGLRLVGTVPDLSKNHWLRWLRPNSGDSAYTQSLLTESVDTARTLVLHAARTEKLQIVMVTSALAGEGKTSLASHLAASLARAGRRTLLLDSDLRNPSLHRLFDMTRGPGLSEVLRGDTDLTGAIRETPIPNLWLISAGQSDPVALQTLALDNMRQIFDQLRPQYEFILVDSCPVLPVADSLLVGQHVDAVIFSLLREISRMPRVYAAYQRLSMLGVRILGAVVNGTQHDRYGGSGYNYRYAASEE